MGGSDKARAKAAKLALEQVAHNAARPGAPKAERQTTIAGLLEVARSSRPRLARAHALRLLGLIGGKVEERALSSLERDPEIGEDARMARERLHRSG